MMLTENGSRSARCPAMAACWCGRIASSPGEATISPVILQQPFGKPCSRSWDAATDRKHRARPASRFRSRWLAEVPQFLTEIDRTVRVGQQAFIGAGGDALFLLSTKFGGNPFFGLPLFLVVPVALAIPSFLFLGGFDR